MSNTIDTDSHEIHVLRDFIEANWSMFSNHCEDFAGRDQSGEEFAEQILTMIGGE
ncbi:hypothetical protein ACH54D_20540 [Atlantibacter hermannii]|uniref:hypothetical protein n=1 Tax=Atlantibacter hermannii TaxID=565 RepID=UPI003251E514